MNALQMILSGRPSRRAVFPAVGAALLLVVGGGRLRADAPGAAGAASQPDSLDAGPWRVSFGDRLKQTSKGATIVVGRKLVIENERLAVEFLQAPAWTLGEIRYEDVIVNQVSGACGAVVQWNNRCDGTGHGYEYVESLRLILDGEARDLLAPREAIPPHGERESRVWQHEQLIPEALPAQGAHVQLHKVSWFGPFRHEALYDFPPARAAFTTTHRFRFVEAFGEGWTGYRYAFMRMVPLAFHQFARWTGDAAPQVEAVDAQRKTYFPFSAPMHALALYAPEHQVGVLITTPQEYPGDHHLLFRAGKDIKFRSILFADETYELGAEIEYTLDYIPFRAAPDAWLPTADKLRLSH